MILIEAYTDYYSPILGDWKNESTIRPVILTGFDGQKMLTGVVNGVTLDIPMSKVYSDRNRTKIKRKAVKVLHEAL